MGAYETNIVYPCFNVFQVIEKEFYSNIYRLNQYTMIEPKKILKRYGIENESPLSPYLLLILLLTLSDNLIYF